MSQSTESKNKALVLRAFDTLFNKRDYAAAGVPNEIQTRVTAVKGRGLPEQDGTLVGLFNDRAHVASRTPALARLHRTRGRAKNRRDRMKRTWHPRLWANSTHLPPWRSFRQ
jgi:hypothetical protein